MSIALLFLASASLCRPSDLLCRRQINMDALAETEVPDFLPTSAECWMDGPCPTDRITEEVVERYARMVNATTDHFPVAFTRQLTRRVEDYHYQCNTEIKRDFASQFSRGDFYPQVRDDYRSATLAFFSSRAGRIIVADREQLGVDDAAKPYDAVSTLQSPWAPKKFAKFLATDAGQWWTRARSTAWQNLTQRGHEPQLLCPTATVAFQDNILGMMVRHGLTEPVVFRPSVGRVAK